MAIVDTAHFDPDALGPGDGSVGDPFNNWDTARNDLALPVADDSVEAICFASLGGSYSPKISLALSGSFAGEFVIRGDRGLANSVNDGTTFIDAGIFRFEGTTSGLAQLEARGGGSIIFRDVQLVNSGSRTINSVAAGYDAMTVEFDRVRLDDSTQGQQQFRFREPTMLRIKNSIMDLGASTDIARWYVVTGSSLEMSNNALMGGTGFAFDIVTSFDPWTLLNNVFSSPTFVGETPPAGSTVGTNSATDTGLQVGGGITYTAADFNDPANGDFSLASQSATVVDAGITQADNALVPLVDIAINDRNATGNTTIGVWAADAEGVAPPAGSAVPMIQSTHIVGTPS